MLGKRSARLLNEIAMALRWHGRIESSGKVKDGKACNAMQYKKNIKNKKKMDREVSVQAKMNPTPYQSMSLLHMGHLRASECRHINCEASSPAANPDQHIIPMWNLVLVYLRILTRLIARSTVLTKSNR